MWVIVLFKKIFAFVLTLLFTYPNIAYCSTYSSSSVCVIDKTTCQTLYENNIYEHRSVASTTKIMTCFIAVQSGKLNDEVTVTDEMLVGVEGSSLYLKANDKISLYDLCVGMMLVSGNDCANVVAYYLSGSMPEFANIMNNTAKKLGMKNTMFVTPSGLDDGNPKTLEEVGKEFNVTRERIRQIEAKALRKLRHPSRSKKLKDFLDQ